jgi:S1-C subfamily serine protease
VGAAVVRDDRRVELDVTPESGVATFMPVPELPVLERLDYLRMIPEATEGLLFDFGATRAPPRLGVTVQELSPQLADYFGVDDGVLVSSVTEESVAAAAGLQAGDVITSVDGSRRLTPAKR